MASWPTRAVRRTHGERAQLRVGSESGRELDAVHLGHHPVAQPRQAVFPKQEAAILKPDMIVLVHGYDGSGPGHWQHWLLDELRSRRQPALFPELSNPLEPVRGVWVRELFEIVGQSASPITFVAHSLGCWAVDHYLKDHGTDGVRGALLVAPPSPYSLFEPIQSFLPPPQSRAAWAPIASKSLVIGSDDDDYAGDDEVQEFASGVGLPCRILSRAGHINAPAGFGPFPLAVEWLVESGALPGAP